MEYLNDKSKTELVALIKKLQVDFELKKKNELQKSAEQFKLLFDAIPDAVFITRIGGNNPGEILDVNISAERQTGYDRDELLEMNIIEDLSTDPFNKATLYEREEKLENHDSIRFTEKKRRKDSSEYWTDVLTIMIDFNNENAALSVNRDITRQKETEIALKENEEKLRNILENSTNMFYSHTPGHVLTYLSPQVKDILGYTPEEAKIRWTELASDNPINEKGFALTVKAIESGQAQPSYELELLHKSGRKVFVEIREAPIVENGVTTSIVGALTDITDRKNVEEAILESEEKYRVLADNSIDVIWQMDLKFVFTYVSPSVKNMVGYTVDEWIGTRLSQHASRKEFIRMVKKALYAIKQYKKNKYINFEAVMLRKDGTEIPVEITGGLLLNKKGLPIGLQGTTRDITERKQAEEELRKHREHLEDLVKDRTAELEEKNEKLEYFNKLFVGREFRIKELRDRVKELEEKISDI